MRNNMNKCMFTEGVQINLDRYKKRFKNPGQKLLLQIKCLQRVLVHLKMAIRIFLQFFVVRLLSWLKTAKHSHYTYYCCKVTFKNMGINRLSWFYNSVIFDKGQNNYNTVFIFHPKPCHIYCKITVICGPFLTLC